MSWRWGHTDDVMMRSEVWCHGFMMSWLCDVILCTRGVFCGEIREMMLGEMVSCLWCHVFSIDIVGFMLYGGNRWFVRYFYMCRPQAQHRFWHSQSNTFVASLSTSNSILLSPPYWSFICWVSLWSRPGLYCWRWSNPRTNCVRMWFKCWRRSSLWLNISIPLKSSWISVYIWSGVWG